MQNAPELRNFGQLVLVLPGHTATSGGSSDSDVNDCAANPAGCAVEATGRNDDARAELRQRIAKDTAIEGHCALPLVFPACSDPAAL